MADNVISPEITDRAKAFIAALNDDQRTRAMFAFADTGQRRDWAYFPRDHVGLPLHDMDRTQQKRAHALIAAGLSLHAYAQVTTIMALENVLNSIESARLDHWRDPGRYFISVFGEPGESEWGWRIEGHHVNLNYTFADGGLISATPLFLGSNPASVRHADVDIVRPCAEEEDIARALMASLDGDQKRLAILSDTAPLDFVLVNVPEIPQRLLPGEAVGFAPLQPVLAAMPAAQKHALAFDGGAPKGLAVARMTDEQQEIMRRLVCVYIDRLPAGAAEAQVSALDFGDLHFAWAGSERLRDPHYYRIQGRTLVIEYDNTQDNANHVHTVLRDSANDFGMDALRVHIQRHHVR